MPFIHVIGEASLYKATMLGGKGAALDNLTKMGVPVPRGFVVLSSAFERFLNETDLGVEISAILNFVNPKAMHTINDAAEQIQALILGAHIPVDIQTDIRASFERLSAKYVAVRSSAVAEDSSIATWAGQLDSYLNTTEGQLLNNVKRCWSSLFTPRSIFYRLERSLAKEDLSVAVVVQEMVASEKSGVAFSVHPITQDKNQLIIEAGFGLGEAIVAGQITPDSYVIEKQSKKIIDVNVSIKTRSLHRSENGGNEWREASTLDRSKQVLSEAEILLLSELILKIEDYFSYPVDIEWAISGASIFILQARPITTLGNMQKSYA